MSGTSEINQQGSHRSTFSVPKMDCPSEENLIRMALSAAPVAAFDFDLQNRRVIIQHKGDSVEILKRLEPLNLGAKLVHSELAQARGESRALLQETTLAVAKMDCPSEENLIRMALANQAVESLHFDLPGRTLVISHTADPDSLLRCLAPLGLGASIKEHRTVERVDDSYRTVFSIPKMDCPSEENLIRMAFQEFADQVRLMFDLKQRQLTVTHRLPASTLLTKLEPLDLGASVLETKQVSVNLPNSLDQSDDAGEAKTLRFLLAINGAMFVVEMLLGLFAKSAGLVADSLDMFADAAVYGLALYAVGRAAHLKVKAAHIAGWLQIVLAIGALTEVVRRFSFGSEPESTLMMGVGLLALVANVTSLVLVSKKRDHGAHMKASYIFSANDVLANIGVIVAGVLVDLTDSSYPDLIIGTVIALIVMRGAIRILKLS